MVLPTGLTRHRLGGGGGGEAPEAVYARELKDVSKIVYAIGYTRNPLPRVYVS
jgi:hypothetical protein